MVLSKYDCFEVTVQNVRAMLLGFVGIAAPGFAQDRTSASRRALRSIWPMTVG